LGFTGAQGRWHSVGFTSRRHRYRSRCRTSSCRRHLPRNAWIINATSVSMQEKTIRRARRFCLRQGPVSQAAGPRIQSKLLVWRALRSELVHPTLASSQNFCDGYEITAIGGRKYPLMATATAAVCPENLRLCPAICPDCSPFAARGDAGGASSLLSVTVEK
jgi:hypothetical protein